MKLRWYRYLVWRWWHDRLPQWISYHLPKRVIYWCSIRVGAHATLGEFKTKVVPELTFMEAIQAWDNSYGQKQSVRVRNLHLYKTYGLLIGPKEEHQLNPRWDNYMTTFKVNKVYLKTQLDAENVLAHLMNIIRDKMYVSVEDYYNLVSAEPIYMDSRYGWDDLSRYGWDDLSRAVVLKDLDGWKLELPQPQLLSELMSKE